MKKLLLVFVAVATIGVVAADKPQQKKVRTPEEIAAAKERMLQKTGGIVEKQGTGKVAVIDCQSRYKEQIAAKSKELQKFIRVDMVNLTGEPVNAANVLSSCAKLPVGVNAALYIVDDPALPMSLMSVEQQWAMINTAHLQNETRFGKQFARGMIMAFSGCTSQYKGSPMQAVRKPEDLDKIMSQAFALDNIICMRRNLEELGVKPSMKATYKKACQDGWADAPTNSYQKAIWEEVHSMPDRPIKIKKQK